MPVPVRLLCLQFFRFSAACATNAFSIRISRIARCDLCKTSRTQALVPAAWAALLMSDRSVSRSGVISIPNLPFMTLDMRTDAKPLSRSQSCERG